jgi:hypothetical protein
LHHKTAAKIIHKMLLLSGKEYSTDFSSWWEAVGLIPPAPNFLNEHRTCRRLYLAGLSAVL